MSRAPTRPTSNPQWRARSRSRASAGARPNSSFNIEHGARKSTKAPAVAKPVSKRISSMCAAIMTVLVQERVGTRTAYLCSRNPTPVKA
jgi:hypothetical protein